MSSLEELRSQTKSTIRELRKHYEKVHPHASNLIVLNLLEEEINNANSSRLKELNTNLEKLLFSEV